MLCGSVGTEEPFLSPFLRLHFGMSAMHAALLLDYDITYVGCYREMEKSEITFLILLSTTIRFRSCYVENCIIPAFNTMSHLLTFHTSFVSLKNICFSHTLPLRL